jgi:hypothetical protein
MLTHVLKLKNVGNLTSMEELYTKIIYPLHEIERYNKDALKAF